MSMSRRIFFEESGCSECPWAQMGRSSVRTRHPATGCQCRVLQLCLNCLALFVACMGHTQQFKRIPQSVKVCKSSWRIGRITVTFETHRNGFLAWRLAVDPPEAWHASPCNTVRCRVPFVAEHHSQRLHAWIRGHHICFESPPHRPICYPVERSIVHSHD